MNRLLALAFLPLLLSGCVPAVVAGTTEAGVSLAEERSIGRKMDDSVIYTDIMNRYAQTNFKQLLLKVTVNVRHARVMLTGTVLDQSSAEQAVALAWQARGVKEVINEIVVNPDRAWTDIANDSLIKRNLEGRILVTKEVWLINYSLDVVNGTAYLLGRVADRGELNRVLNVARTTKGVKRVISHLQIANEQPDPSLPTQPMPAQLNSAPMPNSYPSSSGTGYAAPEAVGSSDLSAPAFSSGTSQPAPEQAPAPAYNTPAPAPASPNYWR